MRMCEDKQKPNYSWKAEWQNIYFLFGDFFWPFAFTKLLSSCLVLLAEKPQNLNGFQARTAAVHFPRTLALLSSQIECLPSKKKDHHEYPAPPRKKT